MFLLVRIEMFHAVKRRHWYVKLNNARWNNVRKTSIINKRTIFRQFPTKSANLPLTFEQLHPFRVGLETRRHGINHLWVGHLEVQRQTERAAVVIGPFLVDKLDIRAKSQIPTCFATIILPQYYISMRKTIRSQYLHVNISLKKNENNKRTGQKETDNTTVLSRYVDSLLAFTRELYP